MKKVLMFSVLFGISLLASSCLDTIAAEDYCDNLDYCWQVGYLADYGLDFYTYTLDLSGHYSRYYEYNDYYSCRDFTDSVSNRIPGCSYEFNRYLDCYSRISCKEIIDSFSGYHSYCDYELRELDNCIYRYY